MNLNTDLVKLTQEGLNALQGAGLPITGNYLELTKAAAAAFVRKLKRYYVQKGFKWDYFGNFGAFRMDDIIDNRFSDWAFNVLSDETVILWPISTLPGLLYMQDKNTQGGIIAEGQHDAYSIQTAWWSGLGFLYQIAPIPYYRDLDFDDKFDRDAFKYPGTGKEGFNVHSFKSSKGWLWDLLVVSDRVAGVLSRGCQVFRASVHKLIWPHMETLAACRQGRVRYTLIRFKEYQEFN